jgi:hypothetical protein
MAEPRMTDPGARHGDPPPVTAAPDAAALWRWVGHAIRPYAGWVLVGVGALFIFFGYLGVSREALVAKQLPYLISGGIFGLALVALGTFYLATEELRHDSRRLDRLERMMFELHAVLLQRSDAPPPEEIQRAVAMLTSGTPTGGTSASNGKAEAEGPRTAVLALPEGHRYHRAGCPMVEGKPLAAEVSLGVIHRRGLEPCSMCEPILQGT